MAQGTLHPAGQSTTLKKRRKIWKERKEYRGGPQFLYLSYLPLVTGRKNKSWCFLLLLPISQAGRIVPCPTQQPLFLLIACPRACGIAPRASGAGKPVSPRQRGESSVHAKYFWE